MRFQAPRGTEDVLPDKSHEWLQLESIFRDLVRLYGYRELRTPTFEDTDLFIRSSGETSDIVSKQMYTFLDKGDRSITLKPEGTAPAMRAVIEHNLCPTGTVARLSYVTPIFRYERPQKGRLREAHQVGLELIGSESVAADAEVIEITLRFYEKIGITGATASINSLGRDECRAHFREAILKVAEPLLKDRDEEFRAKTLKNPLRLLDSKDPEVQAALSEVPPIQTFLEDECKVRFDQLQSLLTEAGLSYQVDAGIVRGLDYYNETVFEVTSNQLGAQSALCGGGRYDGLVKQMGGAPTPSVGVAMGIERALIVLESMGCSTPAFVLDAYLVEATPDAGPAVRKLAASLREAGLAVSHDLDSRSMKSQLKQADKSGARYALILGEDELASGSVTVRDLQSSEQELVPLPEVAKALRGGE